VRSGGKTINLPEEALVAMLRTLPEDVLAEIFWKTLVEYDTSPLTDEEKKAVEEAKAEFNNGESVSWEDIK